MVPEAVAPPQSNRRWQLVGETAAQTQGLVATAFGALPLAEALFLNAPMAGNAWLAALLAALPVTPAVKEEGAEAATALAFTASGLSRLGLPQAVLDGFAAPFVEGMHETNRARRLGDTGTNAPVLEGGPRWSGNPPAAPKGSLATVHALLLVYAKDEAALRQRITLIEGVMAAEGVEILRSLRLSLRRNEALGNVPREHFGFADGFSQPTPFGDAVVMRHHGQGWQDPWHGVPLGDFLLGHVNAHREASPTPLLRESKDDPATALLPKATAAGMRDLGRNGSYLVARELRQDVPAFWKSMHAAAAALGEPGKDADWLAARVVGRERDGDLLKPDGAWPAVDGLPHNDVGFRKHDRHGMGCPIGSHIRRANPRDGTGATETDGDGQLEATNNHRILRRGRKFGPDIADREVDDGVERGLLFLCLNTDIARQFEFTQQTWMLNRGFQMLHGETDPLMGPRGPFTLPSAPLRHRVEVETFVQFLGGEYFFLPSLPALAYLATMQPPKP